MVSISNENSLNCASIMNTTTLAVIGTALAITWLIVTAVAMADYIRKRIKNNPKK